MAGTQTTGDGAGEWTLMNPPESRRASDGLRVIPILANKAPDGDMMPAQVYGTTPERRMARARLIAAAPDMLAACREALLQIEYLHDKFQDTGTGHAALSRLRAAIAKATTP